MRKPSILEGQAAQDSALAKSVEGLKILERLIMQNVHNEILYGMKSCLIENDDFHNQSSCGKCNFLL